MYQQSTRTTNNVSMFTADNDGSIQWIKSQNPSLMAKLILERILLG